MDTLNYNSKYETFHNLLSRIDHFAETMGGLDVLIEILSHSFVVLSIIWLEALIKTFTASSMWPIWIAFFMLWLITNAFVLVGYNIVRRVKSGIKENTNMKTRYALLALRRFFSYAAQKLHDYSSYNMERIDIELFDRFTRHSKSALLRMLFYQISFGNTNLDRMYRVALLEPNDDNELAITSYYNSERRRPRLYSLDRTFKMREGVAGWSWFFRQPFCIPNVPEYLEMCRIGYFEDNAPMYFRDNSGDELVTPFTRGLLEIKSIICYPVVIQAHGEEVVKAIISIDCDKEGALDHTTSQKAKQLRINLYPFVRLFELLFTTIHLVKTKYVNFMPAATK